MLLQSTISSSSPLPCIHRHYLHLHLHHKVPLSMGFLKFTPSNFPFQAIARQCSAPVLITSIRDLGQTIPRLPKTQVLFHFLHVMELGTYTRPGLNASQFLLFRQIFGRELAMKFFTSPISDATSKNLLITEDSTNDRLPLFWMSAVSCGTTLWLSSAKVAHASEDIKLNAVYEIGELFELGIQLSYLLLLLGLLGAGTFFVIRQVLLRRELDLSAKELQEQVRSGDASATGLFELGAVMLRRKFYPAATKYLLQAIEKWDGDDQDLAQVFNALGVSYVRDGKLDKGITQFETAVKLQPGYVTAWNNLGDAYEKKKDIKAALKAFEEVLLFDPNNKVARPRRDGLKERVQMYKGVPVKSKER